MNAQKEEKPVRLAVFSLSAAENHLKQHGAIPDEIRYAGHITRVWALVLDDERNLLLIGERDPAAPCLLLEDVVVAFRTKDKISSNGDDPGVSIEPISTDSDLPLQRVRFTGGVENTHYGQVVFEADLLLKLLSEGYVTTGIEGFPSELDMMIDNQKANRYLDPWQEKSNRSYFFPTKVNFREDKNAVSLTSVTMRVFNSGDTLVQLPEKTIYTDYHTISKLLNEDPKRASPLFTRFLSERYDEVSTYHPVLIELKNMISLSGLFQSLLKDSTVSFKGEGFWKNVYEVRRIETPTYIPALSRAENGLAYSYGIVGGISTSFGIDPWTELMLDRAPDLLREGAIRSQPNNGDPISWVIPVGFGAPDEWRPGLSDSLNAAEYQRLELDYHLKKDSCSCPNRQSLLHIIQKKPFPQSIVTPGWHPPTEGQHIAAFGGSLILNTGGNELYGPGRIYSIGQSDLSFGVLSKLSFIAGNRVEFSLVLPLVTKVKFQDTPSNLPGISDTEIQLKTGLESPTLDFRWMLLNGIRNNRFKRPSLILNNSITFKKHWEIARWGIAGEPAKDFLPFGSNHALTGHGLDLSASLGSKIYCFLSTTYLHSWGKKNQSGTRKLLLHTSVQFQADEESKLIFGVQARTAIERESTDNYFFQQSRLAFQGLQLLGSFSFPKKYGYDTFSLGWYFPHSAPSNDPYNPPVKTKGGFIVELNLDGSRLWNIRKWMGKPKSGIGQR